MTATPARGIIYNIGPLNEQCKHYSNSLRCRVRPFLFQQNTLTTQTRLASHCCILVSDLPLIWSDCRSDWSTLFWHSHAPESPKGCPDVPLHRTGRLPVLARAGASRDQVVHLWTDPAVSEGEPLHHRWIQSLPPLQTVHQEVRRGTEVLSLFQYY